MNTEALYRIRAVDLDPDGNLIRTQKVLGAAVGAAELSDAYPLVIAETPESLSGAPVLLAQDLWKISRNGPFFAIESVFGGGYIGVPDDVDLEGTPLHVLPPHKGESGNEQWNFVVTKSSPEVFEIYCQGRAVGQVMTLVGETGHVVIEKDAHTSPSQYWSLEIVSKGPFRIGDVVTGMFVDVRSIDYSRRGSVKPFESNAFQKWWLVPSQVGARATPTHMIVNVSYAQALVPQTLDDQSPVEAEGVDGSLMKAAWLISPFDNGYVSILPLSGANSDPGVSLALDVFENQLQLSSQVQGSERQWVMFLV